MQYAEFNEIRNVLNELQKFKKPLTKLINKLIYGLGVKYIERFEFYLIETEEESSGEIKKLSADLEIMTDLQLDTKIEITLFKLAKMLEVKEERLKEKLIKST